MALNPLLEWPRLNTDRLDLEPFVPGQVPFLHRLWTDPDVRRFLWDDRIISEAEAASVVTSSSTDFEQHGYGMWVVHLRATGEPIGFCGLRRFGEGSEVEILYGLLPAFWGAGLATEAARAVLRFAFSVAGLDKVYAGADPPNRASIKVMDRLGMAFDGNRIVNGLEAAYYSITRKAFSGLLQRPATDLGISAASLLEQERFERDRELGQSTLERLAKSGIAPEGGK